MGNKDAKATAQQKRRPNGSRDLLLAAARAAFAEKGFEGARVDEIAEQAGVNKQIIYYYFENKDGLFRAALEQIYEGIREQNLQYVATVKPLSADKAIAALVERLFGRLQRQPDVIALVLEENRHKGRHLVSRKVIQGSHTPMFDYVAAILTEGARRGMFRTGIDPRQFYFDMVSLCMFYFINTYTMSAILGKNLLSSASMRARKRHIVEYLVASVSS